MRIKRIEALEAYIRKVGSVSIQQLCDEFQVSVNTVRRDIDTLVHEDKVKKVYGGVVALGAAEDDGSPRTRELMDFDLRNQEYLNEKQWIGQKAAEFVHHGDTIFLDSGSTALQMIPALGLKKNLTVVTYSIPAIAALVQYPQIRTIALPGIILGRTASLVGSSTCQALKQFNCAKAFMGCTGLSLSRQLTNATFEEFEVKQVALAQSRQHYLLADHEKFDHAALMTYGQIASMDYLITNRLPAEAYIQYLEENHVQLILPPEAE